MINFTSLTCTAPPQPNQKVSISSSLSKEFYEIVFIDHFYLDNDRVMHTMDLVSSYLAAHIFEYSSMSDAVTSFEASCATQFWIPQSIIADKAFDNNEFHQYLKDMNIQFSSVPPGNHSKNSIESNHNVIRNVYMRLKIIRIEK